MRIRLKIAAVLLAVAAAVGASADSCSGSSPGSNTGNPAPTQPAPHDTECRGYTFDPPGCPDSTAGPRPSVAVSANPQPTNPGVGQVSGDCHFSIHGPVEDTTGGTGLRAKRMSDVLVEVVGIVYGYCTDTVHDFTIDLHIYAAPIGDAHGDFTKDPNAFEVSNRTAHTPVPGPNLVPYAITAQCLSGLEYQLVWFVTAYDSAGNPIGSRSHPYGGRVAQFSAAECGTQTH